MTQIDMPILDDGVVRLRAPHPDDVDGRFALGNTPEILHMFGIHPDTCEVMTRAMAQDWVMARCKADNFWIVEHEGRLIGDAFLHTINQHDKRASLALGILDPALLGQGFGSRVLHLMIAHCFDTLGLHRITLRVVDYNARAIAAYKKAGFVHEGCERQAARVGNEWHDDIIMGLLAPEYNRGRAA